MTRAFFDRRGEWGAFALLVVILAAGAAWRWYGLAWDQGYLFHPDERQIVLVASNLALPRSLADFFSTSSPLDPHFFAYGSLPIYLFRLLEPLAPPSNFTGPWADDALARWVIYARAISGLFDLGTLVVTFLLGRRLYGAGVGLLAAACVAVTVLHIQLSHFYAVDTLLTFFVLATLYAALGLAQGNERGSAPGRRAKIICGALLGLALATKVSALPLLFPIAFACYSSKKPDRSFETGQVGASLGKGHWLQFAREVWRDIRRPVLEICAVAFAVFVLTQPYALLDWFAFGRDVVRESLVARGWLDFPYTRQYAHTVPYIYQIVQSAVWGMGLPLGVFAWGGAGLFLARFWRGRDWRDAFLLSWGLVYFILIGALYVKYPRYLLPLLPVLYLMAARVTLSLAERTAARRSLAGVLVALILIGSGLYATAFVSIYGREHPWLTASRWIYDNVPPGAVLVIEQWDDSLPVAMDPGSAGRRGSEFQTIALPLYDPDGTAKTQQVAAALSRADFVILASQRVYGSIARLPERYPLTARYYEKLFDGALGFQLAETTRNDPQLGGITVRDDPRSGLPFDGMGLDPTTGLTLDWGFADESLTVYDHPQPFIFRKVRDLSQAELYDLLRR